jgi:hypothetical protein
MPKKKGDDGPHRAANLPPPTRATRGDGRKSIGRRAAAKAMARNGKVKKSRQHQDPHCQIGKGTRNGGAVQSTPIRRNKSK